MLLSVKDFELLKIICWCKNIPAPAGTFFNNVFTVNDISALEYFGIVSISKDGRNIRPRPKAYRLLEDAGYYYKSDLKPQTKIKVLSRRNMAAQILLTFYMAGISVFNNELGGCIDEPLYTASFAVRQNNSSNPFGNARFYGIFCTTREAFLVYAIDDMGVFFQNELRLFHSFIQITGIQKTAIIMMGKSTAEIASNVLPAKKTKKESNNKFITDSFAKIFETTSLPVHFVPIGDAGAQMLKFLLIPDYRKAIAKAIMKKTYKPPYSELPDTDTIHHMPPFSPAVIAVDMDVKRIDRAMANAKSLGYERLAIYALSEQMSFLRSRYGHTGNANIGVIPIDSIKNDLNYNIELFEPPTEQYVSKEGRYYDVSDFKNGRKSREQT